MLDFIDMEKHVAPGEGLPARSSTCSSKDKAKTTVVRISELGLVEMTRKRTRESLGRTMYEPCFYCDGTGHLRSKTTVCHEILRQIRREKDSLPGYKIVRSTRTRRSATCSAARRRLALEEACSRVERRIVVQPRKDYHLEQFDLCAGFDRAPRAAHVEGAVHERRRLR